MCWGQQGNKEQSDLQCFIASMLGSLLCMRCIGCLTKGSMASGHLISLKHPCLASLAAEFSDCAQWVAAPFYFMGPHTCSHLQQQTQVRA